LRWHACSRDGAVVIFDWLFGGWSLRVGAELSTVVAFTIGGILSVALSKFFKGLLSATILSVSRFRAK